MGGGSDAGGPLPSPDRPWSPAVSPKTGIFQISAGDHRRCRFRSGLFGSPETDSQFTKARHWRAFLRVLRLKSPAPDGLAGAGGFKTLDREIVTRITRPPRL